jgi:hypothetical protein
MATVALFLRLEAKPGKERDVEKFLQSGLALVHAFSHAMAMERPRGHPAITLRR